MYKLIILLILSNMDFAQNKQNLDLADLYKKVTEQMTKLFSPLICFMVKSLIYIHNTMSLIASDVYKSACYVNYMQTAKFSPQKKELQINVTPYFSVI